VLAVEQGPPQNWEKNIIPRSVKLLLLHGKAQCWHNTAGGVFLESIKLKLLCVQHAIYNNFHIYRMQHSQI
jgi:hypothetical protein